MANLKEEKYNCSIALAIMTLSAKNKKIALNKQVIPRNPSLSTTNNMAAITITRKKFLLSYRR